MVKVLIADKMSRRAIETFRTRGIDCDEKLEVGVCELKRIISHYDGLAVRSSTQVTKELLEAGAGRLKIVGRAGIGVDNIDQDAATALGICVMNTPYGNSITTAEHTIAMMMALARQIPEANYSTHAGRWEKSSFMGVELYGKTLGVVGCGNIGAIVCDRALGLAMKVLTFDPYLSDVRAKSLGVEKVSLDVLLKRADFLTLHTPLTDGTRGIINSETLAKAKTGIRIINCARGGLIVEEDLKLAIESGHVAGAALDVYTKEPAEDNVLFGLPRVIATPHLGASTEEAQENVALQVAEQISDFLLTGAITNALNMASVSAEDAPKLKPYFELARKLGSFAGQLTRTAIKLVHIEYCGYVATLNNRPLSAVILEGLLRPQMDTVNMVNAPFIAKQRNIDLRETSIENCGDYQTLIRVTVTTETQTRDVAGTLFTNDRPRVVSVKGIELEAELGNHMLYVTNEDRPGFIGALGSVLGASDVNIATFHLGRATLGGDAIALVQVDQAIDTETLDKIRDLPHVGQAQTLSF